MHWLDVWVPLCVKTQLLYNWSICGVDIPAHRYSQTGRQDLCRLCACYSYIWKPVNTTLWEIHVINNNYWCSLVSSDTLSVAYWPLCWKECCPLIWPRQELMMSSWCKAGVKPSILLVSENLTKEKSIRAHAASSMMLSDKSKERWTQSVWNDWAVQEYGGRFSFGGWRFLVFFKEGVLILL